MVLKWDVAGSWGRTGLTDRIEALAGLGGLGML